MDSKKHNAKRKKRVVRKRVRIAVFMLSSLELFCLFSNISDLCRKRFLNESVSHLTEIFHLV